MGLFNFIHKVAALTEHDSLSKQLSQNKAKGFDDLQARGLLIAQRWSLPQTPEASIVKYRCDYCGPSGADR